MIKIHSSLATAQIVVQLVLNDVLTKNIQATVQSFVNSKNSVEQGLSIKKDSNFFGIDGVILHIYEASDCTDIIIQRSDRRGDQWKTSFHNFNREFDRAANYIVDQLRKHFPKDV
jgi:hypothetical protein